MEALDGNAIGGILYHVFGGAPSRSRTRAAAAAPGANPARVT